LSSGNPASVRGRGRARRETPVSVATGTADADPGTGYDVRVDGSDTVIGGTSAVAPLWAGLVALLNQLKGRPVGYLNPKLYSGAAAFHDIAEGNNNGFTAAPGWDACTGLGSPIGSKLLGVL
jgi:kumamolisin